MGGDEIGGQVTGIAGLPGNDDDLRDVGVGRQGGFDLAGFDAVATNLDLGVDTPQVVQLTVGGEAGEVAGAVHA